MTLTGDDLVLSLDNGQEIRAAWTATRIAGQIHRGGKPIDRVWLVKRTGPLVWESNYDAVAG